MAAYKYEQLFWNDDGSQGYVKYNITPDFGSYVSSDTPVILQLELKNSEFNTNSITIGVTDDNDNFSFGFININIPKGNVTEYTAKIFLDDISDWSNNNTFQVIPFFVFNKEIGGTGQGKATDWESVKSQQRITFLKHDIKPSIEDISFNRYDRHELSEGVYEYVRNDEGQYVYGAFKIGLASGYDEEDISTAIVQVSDGINVIFTADLTEIDGFLVSALSQTGYVENEPTLFTNEIEPATDPPTYEPVLFDGSIDYTITFTIGDEFTVVTNSIEISRAFANLHLSGYETGGVAFGRFSSSEQNNPKFESEYPAFLYGGINEIGNALGSLMAFGLQVGSVAATSIPDDNATETTVVFKRKYASAPIVVCGICPPPASNSKYLGSCSVAVGSVGTDSFNLVRANRSGHSVVFGASWIAIGQPNTDPNSWGVVTVTRPASAMTSNNSQNCIATASSEYSSKYKAYQAFSSSREKGWACDPDDSTPWIQLLMDENNVGFALKNIIVSVYSRDATVHNPIAGEIKGSNDGTNYSKIGEFSGWSSTARNALLGTIECKNETAYKYVRIEVTQKADPNNYIAIGHITIEGDYEAPSGE